MSAMRIAGVVLIVLGFAGLFLGGIPYGKTSTVAEFGELKMSVREEKRLTIPPPICGLVILAGAVLLFVRRSGPASGTS